MRRHGSIEDLGLLDRHDHVAWWGRGPDEMDRVTVGALATAAALHERMLFVADDPAPGRLAGLPDLEAMIARGDLELVPVRDVYEDAERFDPARQRRLFEGVLEDALVRGYSGLRVVADNTPFLRGSDAAFSSWLEWEYLADRLQAEHPVAGVCFFDVSGVQADRLADLAAVHPLLPSGSEQPPFRLFSDDGVLRVVGSLEALFADRMERALAALPGDRPLVVDLSTADFVDHRALLTLNHAASPGQTIVVRGARPVTRRVWDLLEVPTPKLVFERDQEGPAGR